ncbi:MAG TPA: hypothetical protein VLW75_06375, partial [Rhizomicrobium sp.]|nr:hypothetical protein [Rhizomicrobium sp.]
LQRRPHIEANGIVSWTPSEDWSAGASVAYVGNRIDQYDTSVSPAVPFRNGGYTLANVFGEYDFGRFALYGRVENLFGARYLPELGYGAAGRAFYIGVRARE